MPYTIVWHVMELAQPTQSSGGLVLYSFWVSSRLTPLPGLVPFTALLDRCHCRPANRWLLVLRLVLQGKMLPPQLILQRCSSSWTREVSLVWCMPGWSAPAGS